MRKDSYGGLILEMPIYHAHVPLVIASSGTRHSPLNDDDETFIYANRRQIQMRFGDLPFAFLVSCSMIHAALLADRLCLS
ncbi:hypothetical protein L1049_012837 [Liquidambar formosana]|uniref:Uncharacterized protein n=1 Tax=Liquidambar formosana TaxID=63359 RepID=A0AAP0WXF3_LIQFO